jgi:hypothetical protein
MSKPPHRRREVLAFVLALSMTAGTALAQGPPQTGMMKSAVITLGRVDTKFSAGPLGSVETTTDSVSATFQLTDYSKFIPVPTPTFMTIGPCLVATITAPQSPPPDNSGAITPLNAGPVLNVTWPNGTKQLPALNFSFTGVLGGGLSLPGLPPAAPLVLDPETVTVDNGAGGPDVPAFVATLTIPGPAFMWTNPDADLSIDRTVGVNVTWVGGDPNSKVNINGGVVTLDPATHQLSGGAIFACIADNSAGQFFVTPDVLGYLPATVDVNGVSNGSLTVSNGVQSTFNLPGIDSSTISFTTLYTRSPEYQ